MSDSSGSVETLDQVPYSLSPEWQDVKPIYYDDGGRVVAIQYSDSHREAMAYFRAVLASVRLGLKD